MPEEQTQVFKEWGEDLLQARLSVYTLSHVNPGRSEVKPRWTVVRRSIEIRYLVAIHE